MRFDYKISKQIVLGDFLKSQGISRRMGRKIKAHGLITVNGAKAYFYTMLYPGDYLILEYREEVNENMPLSPYPLNIIYQDEWLLVISKPADLSVQPSKKHSSDNLVARIKNYYNSVGLHCNIHIVNRLDYATSGLMLVAKEGHTHHLLSSIPLERKYLAIVSGIPAISGIVDLPIARDSSHRIKRMIDPMGRKAITEYRLLAVQDRNGIVELKLKTGRTHQIRLHMAALSHPVIGDRLYGFGGNRLMLHSYYLSFVHPYKNDFKEFVDYPKWY